MTVLKYDDVTRDLGYYIDNFQKILCSSTFIQIFIAKV